VTLEDRAVWIAAGSAEVPGKKAVVVVVVVVVVVIIIIIIIIMDKNIFHERHNISCSTNCKYRTAATLYTAETWFVSGI